MQPHDWLSPWESFYVIVGSSAAALTGLQFVVMALIADVPRAGSESTISAFGTPTVVHFCSALLVAATLSAPWPTVAGAREMLGLIGLAGVVYAVIVSLRARRQTGYEPVLEDWIFHSILPFLAYGGILVAALLMGSNPVGSLFTIGAMTLMLVFVGIHNAWDTVTFITTTVAPAARAKAARDAAPSGATAASPEPSAPTPSVQTSEPRAQNPESR